MPSIKISDLDIATAIASDERIVILADPSGTPEVKTIEKETFFSQLFCGVKANQTGATSITSSGVAIPFAGESWDTDAFHDTVTNNTRFTAPKDGYYSFTGQLKISANAVLGLAVRLGGSTIIARATRGNGGSPEYCQVTGEYYLTAGQYIEFVGYAGTTQNSSGDVETFGIMRLIG